jgi:hypothetical protein
MFAIVWTPMSPIALAKRSTPVIAATSTPAFDLALRTDRLPLAIVPETALTESATSSISTAVPQPRFAIGRALIWATVLGPLWTLAIGPPPTREPMCATTCDQAGQTRYA